MKVSLKEIYIQFLFLGLQLLGGGYVIVPLMKKYFIEQRQWMTDDDLSDFYALSQSIPGIIAANISAFVGYKLRGKIGAALALLGIITTPVISIIIVAMIVDKLLAFSLIQSIFWGVGVAVVILIYLSVKEIWQNSMSDMFSWLIFIATVCLSLFFKVSPAMIIVLSVVFGLAYKFIEEKSVKK